MPMAACRAAAEWAGWICRKDGRAQRVQTALISRLYAENSNWRPVLPRLGLGRFGYRRISAVMAPYGAHTRSSSR